MHTALKELFLVPYSCALYFSWTEALLGSKTDVLGLTAQVQVLKVGVPEVEFRPFTPQGEAWSLSSLLIVGHHTKGGLHGYMLSQSLLPVSV